MKSQFHTHLPFFLTFCRFAKIYKLEIFKNLSFAKASTCEILKNLPFAQISTREIPFFLARENQYASTLVISRVVEQSLLQTSAGVSKQGNFNTKWNRYYKVGLPRAITKWDKSYQEIEASNLLQSGQVATAEWGNFIKKWSRYYKIGHLLQSRSVHRTKVRQGIGPKSIAFPKCLLVVCTKCTKGFESRVV